jgi:hypothetical protein
MDPNHVKLELQRVTSDLLKINLSIFHSARTPWLEERIVRCTLCKRREFCVLTLRTEMLLMNGRLKDTQFEIVDGFCLNCDADWLWPMLCKSDQALDPALAGAACKRRSDGLCEGCLESTVKGIWRNGTCTGGECHICRRLVLPFRLNRRRRHILVNANRIRRELKRQQKCLRALLAVAELDPDIKPA